MTSDNATCTVCSKIFRPRMTYQTEARGDVARFYCSLPCRAGQTPSAVRCDVCGTAFALTFAYQASRDPRDPARTRYACSEACKQKTTAATTTTVAPPTAATSL